MNEQFDKFIENFDINDNNIKKKYDHSLRVQRISEEIASSENFDKEKYLLASLIGLLHDYGRFYQWEKYKTYSDRESIDHGDYAVQRLFDKGEIKNFYNSHDNYNVIYEAIKYHNKYEVPLNVESMNLCNLVRDADKLDILYMYTIGELSLMEDGEVSDSVSKAFFEHRLIDNKLIKSKIDISIRTLCLIYDLNFNYSYKFLIDNSIIEKIYENVKNKEKLKVYFDEIKRFLERK